MTQHLCPLCGNNDCIEIDRNRQRAFHQCRHCALVFVPAAYHLSPSEEKSIYDYHQNNPDDEGYRTFLSRLTSPLIARLLPGAEGLDMGCGPGPTLPLIMEEAGFYCSHFDPFYFPDKAALNRRYDFVTATEVVEHFCAPQQSFKQLFSLLKPGGMLGIMTKTIPAFSRFSDWHYTRDLTHVSFYARETLAYIAKQYQCSLDLLRADVAILTHIDSSALNASSP